MQVRKQQLELVMEQPSGSKSEKEYVRAVYCHLAYLTSVQSASDFPGGSEVKVSAWNAVSQEKLQNLRYADDTTLMAESEEELN